MEMEKLKYENFSEGRKQALIELKQHPRNFKTLLFNEYWGKKKSKAEICRIYDVTLETLDVAIKEDSEDIK